MERHAQAGRRRAVRDPVDVRVAEISRCPSSPCGGILAGGPKGEGYQYTETITWGTEGEQQNYCIGGVVDISVDGDVMKFDWSTVSNGTETRTVGELKRQGARKR